MNSILLRVHRGIVGPEWLDELGRPWRFWPHRLSNQLIDFVVWRVAATLLRPVLRVWEGVVWLLTGKHLGMADHLWSGHYGLGDRYPLSAMPAEIRTVAQAWGLPHGTVSLGHTPSWTSLQSWKHTRLCTIYNRRDHTGWSERNILVCDAIAARSGDSLTLDRRAAGFAADVRDYHQRRAAELRAEGAEA